jgi:hypothetical protein
LGLRATESQDHTREQRDEGGILEEGFGQLSAGWAEKQRQGREGSGPCLDVGLRHCLPPVTWENEGGFTALLENSKSKRSLPPKSESRGLSQIGRVAVGTTISPLVSLSIKLRPHLCVFFLPGVWLVLGHLKQGTKGLSHQETLRIWESGMGMCLAPCHITQAWSSADIEQDALELGAGGWELDGKWGMDLRALLGRLSGT